MERVEVEAEAEHAEGLGAAVHRAARLARPVEARALPLEEVGLAPVERRREEQGRVAQRPGLGAGGGRLDPLDGLERLGRRRRPRPAAPPAPRGRGRGRRTRPAARRRSRRRTTRTSRSPRPRRGDAGPAAAARCRAAGPLGRLDGVARLAERGPAEPVLGVADPDPVGGLDPAPGVDARDDRAGGVLDRVAHRGGGEPGPRRQPAPERLEEVEARSSGSAPRRSRRRGRRPPWPAPSCPSRSQARPISSTRSVKSVAASSARGAGVVEADQVGERAIAEEHLQLASRRRPPPARAGRRSRCREASGGSEWSSTPSSEQAQPTPSPASTSSASGETEPSAGHIPAGGAPKRRAWLSMASRTCQRASSDAAEARRQLEARAGPGGRSRCRRPAAGWGGSRASSSAPPARARPSARQRGTTAASSRRCAASR